MSTPTGTTAQVDQAWTDNNTKDLKDALAKPGARQAFTHETNGNIKEHERFENVPVKSKKKKIPLPVYKISTDVVKYNFENVRIKKWKVRECNRLGVTELDPRKREHQDVVQEILLKTKSYTAQSSASLKEDMAEKEQEDPALITPDGVLLNGNRRCAVLRDFYTDGFTSEKGNNIQAGEPKWKEILVCPLPQLSELELKLLEKRIQQKPKTEQDYGGINEMIDIRDEFRNTFRDNGVMRNYLADTEAEGGATVQEKKDLQIFFQDLQDKSVSFDWLCKQVDIIDLIDQHLAMRPNDANGKSMEGHYDLVENDKVFSGGITTFVEILKYEAKLEAMAGDDDTFVEKHMLAVMTAIRNGKVEFDWIRGLNHLTTPKIKRKGKAKQVDCETIFDGLSATSDIISNYSKYVANPELLEDSALQQQEASHMAGVTFSYQRALEDPKVVLKNILSTLKTAFFKQNAINNDSVPTGDAEFSKIAKEATSKLQDIENAASRA